MRRCAKPSMMSAHALTLAGVLAAVAAALGIKHQRAAPMPAAPRAVGTPPSLAWSVGAGKNGTKSDPTLSLDHTLLYIGLNDGDVVALDTSSGERRWRFPTKGQVFVRSLARHTPHATHPAGRVLQRVATHHRPSPTLLCAGHGRRAPI